MFESCRAHGSTNHLETAMHRGEWGSVHPTLAPIAGRVRHGSVGSLGVLPVSSRGLRCGPWRIMATY
jgi:hypothetical protein